MEGFFKEVKIVCHLRGNGKIEVVCGEGGGFVLYFSQKFCLPLSMFLCVVDEGVFFFWWCVFFFLVWLVCCFVSETEKGSRRAEKRLLALFVLKGGKNRISSAVSGLVFRNWGRRRTKKGFWDLRGREKCRL